MKKYTGLLLSVFMVTCGISATSIFATTSTTPTNALPSYENGYDGIGTARYEKDYTDSGFLQERNSSIAVTLNDEFIDCSQSAPVNIDGRVLVPLRAIFEALGVNVDWDNNSRTVTATTETVTFKMVIGEEKYTVNNEVFTSDTTAQIINSSTMVPVRVVSESLGCNVGWDGSTQTVIITSDDVNVEIKENKIVEYTDLEFVSIINNEIVRFTNIERVKEGLEELKVDEDLFKGAVFKSEDMATRDYFSHEDSDGNYVYKKYGGSAENIAVNSNNASNKSLEKAISIANSFVTQWMNSDGHRANILNSANVSMGAGVAFSTTAQYSCYATQIFGRK